MKKMPIRLQRLKNKEINMISIDNKSDIAKLNPGDVVNLDTYENGNITGEVIKKLDNMIILKTQDNPYLKILY